MAYCAQLSLQQFQSSIFHSKYTAKQKRDVRSARYITVRGLSNNPISDSLSYYLLTISANFRKIRPSFGNSGASASTPSQSTSESTGSDPRRNRGEKEIAKSSSTSSRRRRVPESVTRNACLNCKKARAKVSTVQYIA